VLVSTRRGDALRQGTQNYADRHKIEVTFPGLPYILLHSPFRCAGGRDRARFAAANGVNNNDFHGISESSGIQFCSGNEGGKAVRCSSRARSVKDHLSISSCRRTVITEQEINRDSRRDEA
jgi:hypothetical protein